jgi:hypothetical protein
MDRDINPIERLYLKLHPAPTHLGEECPNFFDEGFVFLDGPRIGFGMGIGKFNEKCTHPKRLRNLAL